jgi:hypothetical protein
LGEFAHHIQIRPRQYFEFPGSVDPQHNGAEYDSLQVQIPLPLHLPLNIRHLDMALCRLRDRVGEVSRDRNGDKILLFMSIQCCIREGRFLSGVLELRESR